MPSARNAKSGNMFVPHKTLARERNKHRFVFTTAAVYEITGAAVFLVAASIFVARRTQRHTSLPVRGGRGAPVRACVRACVRAWDLNRSVSTFVAFRSCVCCAGGALEIELAPYPPSSSCVLERHCTSGASVELGRTRRLPLPAPYPPPSSCVLERHCTSGASVELGCTHHLPLPAPYPPSPSCVCCAAVRSEFKPSLAYHH